MPFTVSLSERASRILGASDNLAADVEAQEEKFRVWGVLGMGSPKLRRDGE